MMVNIIHFYIQKKSAAKWSE